LNTSGNWAILQPHKDLEVLIATASEQVQRICYISGKKQLISQLEIDHPFIDWRENPRDKTIRRAFQQLKQYFQGKRKAFDLPLAFHGTDFQKLVWTGLMKVPFGDLLSYGDLANYIDKPKAARAVGGAVGNCNHLIVVPCHRVIAGDGSIGGFGSNLHLKRILLQVEGHSF
jgi:methylated-DNA-[protein]-cysteine S-methyltransferase